MPRHARVVRVALAGVMVAAAAMVVESAQAPSGRLALTGTWRLEPAEPPENIDDWQRLTQPQAPPVMVVPCHMIPAGGLSGGGTSTTTATCLAGQGAPSASAGLPPTRLAFGPNLLAPVRDLTLAVGDDTVTVDHAGGPRTTYATRNRNERHRIWTTDAQVKTRWDRDALVQEFSGREGEARFKIRQTLRLGADGRLALEIEVLEPRLRPRVGKITRHYRR